MTTPVFSGGPSSREASSLFALEQFKDGPTGRDEREAAIAAGREIARAVERTNEFLRRCRVGRIVDRRPIAERMAAVMARCYRARGRCFYGDLLAAGFTRQEIRLNAAEARGVARRLVVRVMS